MIPSKIISRSNVRSADVPMEYNLCLDPLCGEPKQIVKPKNDTIDNNPDQNEIQQYILQILWGDHFY